MNWMIVSYELDDNG